MPMDPKIKADWLAALRSGKYEQCRSHLHQQGGGFCCLGVLADIQGVEWIGGETPDKRMVPIKDGRLLSSGGTDYPNRAGTLNHGFEEEMGIRSESSQLMTMNDQGSSFSMIADHIEANL
jgi:hypothetical protein